LIIPGSQKESETKEQNKGPEGYNDPLLLILAIFSIDSGKEVITH
jgi:hypothetical protein